MKLRGKLPPNLLKGEILEKLPTQGKGVILGPALGEDAAIIDVGNGTIAIHSDPVTGGGELAGWLSVYVASNDIATRGVKPDWLLTVFLFRENISKEEIREIVNQVGEAAKQIDAVVVGGHTEVTPSLPFNIVVTTALGLSKGKILNTRDAKEGDKLIVTKAVGLEGTAILATELEDELKKKGVAKSTLVNSQGFIREISIVKEALISKDIANSMHDPTEGGLIGGVQEMALASGHGFRIYEDRVPIRKETLEICRALGIDPLKLISSGSLLISVRNERATELVNLLKSKGVNASIIGELTPEVEGMKLVRKDGSEDDLSMPVVDELWRVLD